MSGSKPKSSKTEKKLELMTTVRDFVVRLVHGEGKWETRGLTKVMSVNTHDLNIRYYTPFQKRKSTYAIEGDQFGYHLEVWMGRDLILLIMWNAGKPVSFRWHHKGLWEKYLLPLVADTAIAAQEQQMSAAS
jgi:hypothetical protein